MPIPSDQSYQDFVRSAFSILTNLGPALPNAGVTVSCLYQLYCYYNSNPNIQAKVPLAGTQLYQATFDLLVNSHTDDKYRFIRIQDDDLSVMDQPAALQQYGSLVQNSNVITTNQPAITALTSYLHIYPDGTKWPDRNTNKLKRPNNRGGIINWRFGINVVPNSIAAAVKALMPILDQYPEIDHIKFSAPGRANKLDSVIIYLLKPANTDNTIKQAVQQAITNANVQIQLNFSPMWNEYANGYGEAAEAPTNGYSFGMFRCILAYLAYPRRPSTAATLSLQDYQARVDKTFETFGIPLFAPHEQGQLLAPPYNHPIRIRFMRALALYRNLRANAFQNLQLTVPRV